MNSTLPRRHWKDQLHLLHGTGGQGSQGPTFSADIDIVAYNVDKHITSVDLSNCLSENGLSIKDCKLLTTSENGRSLSYKITISAGEFEKTTKDVSISPYRVGVRLFKHFSIAKTTNQNAHKDKKPFIKEDRYPKQQPQRLKIRSFVNPITRRHRVIQEIISDQEFLLMKIQEVSSIQLFYLEKIQGSFVNPIQ